MKLRLHVVCFILGAGALGCSKGEPSFEVLGTDNLPRPTFNNNGSTTLSLTTSSSTSTFTVSGQCDAKIKGLVASAPGAVNVTSLSDMVTGLSVTCGTDGKFSFTLDSLADLGFAPVEGQTYEVQLRADTSGGVSKASLIRLTYSSSSRRPVLLTAGSGHPTDGSPTGFSADVRLSERHHPGLATDGSPGGFSAVVGVRGGAN